MAEKGFKLEGSGLLDIPELGIRIKGEKWTQDAIPAHVPGTNLTLTKQDMERLCPKGTTITEVEILTPEESIRKKLRQV